MARDFNGSNQYGSVALDLTAYSTLTLAFWLYVDNWASGGDYDVLLEFTSDGQANAGGFHVYNEGGAGNGIVVAHRGNVGASNATYGAANRPSTGAWHHYACIYDLSLSTDEVNFYLDGVLQTPTSRPSNTNNGGTFASDTLYVACRTGPLFLPDGKLAEVALFNGALSADKVAALAKKYTPDRVAPSQIIEYWPFIGRTSPEPGMRGVGNVTLVNSPAQIDHPPIIRRRRAQGFVPKVVSGGGGGGFSPWWASARSGVIGAGVN